LPHLIKLLYLTLLFLSLITFSNASHFNLRKAINADYRSRWKYEK
jgi:hypothetical protein